jgi:hypothetical protein
MRSATSVRLFQLMVLLSAAKLDASIVRVNLETLSLARLFSAWSWVTVNSHNPLIN